MKLNITLQGGRTRKKLIPLSPARKQIKFAAETEYSPAPTPRKDLRGAALELCTYYLQLGLGPAQALRSALADLPEAAV